jgi:hypothetical protein
MQQARARCRASSGYTILFGANPKEAADLAAISYKVAALSLIQVAIAWRAATARRNTTD